MAKQKEGVYERIIECTKKEFLKNGFKDASLRVIAQEAGTSTSSIYVRFNDKEGLFKAIVSPVMEEFEKYFFEKNAVFDNFDDYEKEQILYDYSQECNNDMVDFIYDHFVEFKLLLKCSYGTEFYDFIERLVEIEVDFTVKFLNSVKNDAIKSGRVTKQFLHIIARSYLSGLFEIVLHDMSKEEAKKYAYQLRQFYCAGHQWIYNPENINFK